MIPVANSDTIRLLLMHRIMLTTFLENDRLDPTVLSAFLRTGNQALTHMTAEGLALPELVHPG